MRYEAAASHTRPSINPGFDWLWPWHLLLARNATDESMLALAGAGSPACRAEQRLALGDAEHCGGVKGGLLPGLRSWSGSRRWCLGGAGPHESAFVCEDDCLHAVA
jgi:hypothetical protein